MIIWGGHNTQYSPPCVATDIYSQAGLSYDPVSDIWTSLTTASAPSGRQLHTAVDTTDTMLIWGGQAPQGLGVRYLGDGGRYILLENYDGDGDGYSICAGDCNDGDPSIHPGAGELCNGVDDNCNGQVDEGSPALPDVDGDGFSACQGDCNDGNAAVHPGAAEVCNLIDDNCNGLIDEGFDQDGDGYKSCSGDCNDANPSIHPGAAELCNGVDDNCDGTVDEGFDHDGDGYSPCGGDCNDADPAIHPGAVEICDGLDDDCNGIVEDNLDGDGDGYTRCAPDCNDSDPGVWDYPVELAGLTVDPGFPTLVSWPDLGPFIGPAIAYDVVSGSMGPGAGINFSGGSCVQSGTSDPGYSDSRPNPLPGSGNWYLSRARNACGIGTYGASSTGVERVLPNCP